jgi:peroxiredoxin
LSSFHDLPEGLPVPVDDGAADHLRGALIADVALSSTAGGSAISLRALTQKPTVLFFYPRTGVPGQAPNRGFSGEDWDEIPGARGCTPQSCAFRDAYSELQRFGVQVFGVSTQVTEFQREFTQRNHIPFAYLSDAELRLAEAMKLPTFEFPVESGGPNRLIKRMAWYVEAGEIVHVWYPVFPPNENAAQVLEWLAAR